METAEFVEFVDQEGRSLAAAAKAAGVDAEVPTCPEWRVRDLLRHTGAVHRWAASFIAEGHTSPRPLGDHPELDGPELLTWYRDSHRLLVDTLAGASADTAAWTFHPAPAPSPLFFWARRQAHETAVHRYDAESALGGTPGPVTPGFAADGIDELLRGFHARSRSQVRTEAPRVLRVRVLDAAPGAVVGTAPATDPDAVWTVRLSPEPPVTTRDEAGDADCELGGTAEQLYLALWNRRTVPYVTGDASLAALWREKSAIG